MSVDEANDATTATSSSSPQSSSASSTTSTTGPRPAVAQSAPSLEQRASEGLLIQNPIANNGTPNNMSCRKYTRSSLLAIGKSLDLGTDTNELGKKLVKFETGQWRDELELMQEHSDADKEQDDSSGDQANQTRRKLVRSLTSFGRQRSEFEGNCRDNQFRNFHTKDKRQNSITSQPAKNNPRLQPQQSIELANQRSGLNRKVSSPQLRWSRSIDVDQINSNKTSLSLKLDGKNKNCLTIASSTTSGNNATRCSSLDTHSPLRKKPNDVVMMQLRPKPKVNLAIASKQPNSALFSASLDNHMEIPPVIRIEARNDGAPLASRPDESYDAGASGETDEFDLSSLLSLTVFSDFNADSTSNASGKNKRDEPSGAGELGKATRKMLKQHGRAKTMSDFSASKRNVGGKISGQNSSLGMMIPEPIPTKANHENDPPYLPHLAALEQEAEDGYYSIDLGVPKNYATSYMITDQSSLLASTSSKKQIERKQPVLDEKVAKIIENFKSQVKARASGEIDAENQSKCQDLTTTTTKESPEQTKIAVLDDDNNDRSPEPKQDTDHSSRLQEKTAAESIIELQRVASDSGIANEAFEKAKKENPDQSQSGGPVTTQTTKSEPIPSRLPRLVRKVSLKIGENNIANVASACEPSAPSSASRAKTISDADRKVGMSRIARAFVTRSSPSATASSKSSIN